MKQNKSSIFGKCKGPLTLKVKWISLRLKEMLFHSCTVHKPFSCAAIDYRRIGRWGSKFQTSTVKTQNEAQMWCKSEVIFAYSYG